MRIFPISNKRIDRAVAASIGEIDLRPRLQVHSDSLAAIIDRLTADKMVEEAKQARLREEMEESVDAVRDIERLIKGYTNARNDFL